MKFILIAFILSIHAMSAQELPKLSSDFTINTDSSSALTFTTSITYPQITIGENSIRFQFKDGTLVLDLKTGKTTLPKGVKPDKAAQEFWNALVKSLPGVKRRLAVEALSEVVNKAYPLDE